jgi:hypothetical protein
MWQVFHQKDRSDQHFVTCRLSDSPRISRMLLVLGNPCTGLERLAGTLSCGTLHLRDGNGKQRVGLDKLALLF